jgi:hypothetical protein
MTIAVQNGPEHCEIDMLIQISSLQERSEHLAVNDCGFEVPHQDLDSPEKADMPVHWTANAYGVLKPSFENRGALGDEG